MEGSAVLNRLCQIEDGNPNDFSLYNGKTGLSILYFLLSDIFTDKIYLEKARELINDVFDHISEIPGYEFADGLSGIGWGIEWLFQNKFLDKSNTYLLNDFDEELYRVINYCKSCDLSIKSGATGKALYIQKRFVSRGHNHTSTKLIRLNESLVFLTDEMTDALIDSRELEPIDELKFNRVKLIEIAQTALFLAQFKSLNINVEMVTKGIKTALQVLYKHFSSENEFKFDISMPYLIYCYLKIGCYLKDNSIIKQGIFFNRKYNFSAKTRLNLNSLSQLYEPKSILNNLLSEQLEVLTVSSEILDSLSKFNYLNYKSFDYSCFEAWGL